MELSSFESIAVLSFPEQPPYPRLSSETLIQLRDQLRAIVSARCFAGLVIASNSISFATGAEIEQVSRLSGFAAFEFARTGQAVLHEIASATLPVVAAIRGFCLGGGLELALACQGRVAAFNASFGCPGATLGLLTGWRGTQRLERLVGKSAAVQMLVTGERIPATQAMTLGLIDELVASPDLVAVAARRAASIAIKTRQTCTPFGSLP